jgi:hypothetical protein
VEVHQALRPIGVALSALAFCAASLGCADNPEPPDVYDRNLVPIEIYPPLGDETISRNQTFVVTFNTYLDLAPQTYWNTLSIASGGVTAFGPTSYRMVDRQLVLRTTRDMEPNLVYQLGFNAEALKSVTGKPYAGPPVVSYTSDDTFEPEPPEPPPYPVWADVAPIFDRCNDCHGDPEWKLDVLSVETMVARPSRQAHGVPIVEPYFPWRSYLMHKVLWDYPIREHSAQPPAWAGYEQLSIEDQRLLERWILAGARETR